MRRYRHRSLRWFARRIVIGLPGALMAREQPGPECHMLSPFAVVRLTRVTPSELESARCISGASTKAAYQTKNGVTLELLSSPQASWPLAR